MRFAAASLVLAAALLASGCGTTTKIQRSGSSAQGFHTLILLAYFQDQQPGSLSTSAAQADFFTGLGAGPFYEQMSYGTVTIDGEAHGWYRIPYTSNVDCNYNAWGQAAKNAALADGVDVASFDHFIYVFSTGVGSACYGLDFAAPDQVWGGAGVVTDPPLSRHEFGHAIGLAHSDLGPLGGEPYGRLPAAQLLELGWLDAPVMSDGTYTLTSVEQPSGLRALQMPRGDGTRLVIEYRADLGGVYIESDSGSTYSYAYAYTADPCGGRLLQPAHSYYDPVSRTLINQGSTPGVVTVLTNADPPAVVPDTTPPTIPANLAGVKQGSGVTLTWEPSTDAGCPPITYTITRNGSTFGQTTLPRFFDAHTPKRTTFTYTVTATDPSGNVSATSTVTVKT